MVELSKLKKHEQELNRMFDDVRRELQSETNDSQKDRLEKALKHIDEACHNLRQYEYVKNVGKHVE